MAVIIGPNPSKHESLALLIFGTIASAFGSIILAGMLAWCDVAQPGPMKVALAVMIFFAILCFSGSLLMYLNNSPMTSPAEDYTKSKNSWYNSDDHDEWNSQREYSEAKNKKSKKPDFKKVPIDMLREDVKDITTVAEYAKNRDKYIEIVRSSLHASK